MNYPSEDDYVANIRRRREAAKLAETPQPATPQPAQADVGALASPASKEDAEDDEAPIPAWQSTAVAVVQAKEEAAAQPSWQAQFCRHPGHEHVLITAHPRRKELALCDICGCTAASTLSLSLSTNCVHALPRTRERYIHASRET